MKISTKKIVAGIKRKLKFIVPKNSAYRPQGFYNTLLEYSENEKESGADVKLIYKDYDLELCLPDGLIDLFPFYYKPVLKSVQDYFIVEVPEGRIYSDNLFTVAIISSRNKLLGDISFQYSKSKLLQPDQGHIFKQTYFEDLKEIDGTVFNLATGGGGTNNYMHFLFDGVTRIHLLKKSGIFDQVDYFYVPSLKYDFQRDIFKLLGIESSRLISAEDVSHLKARKIVASTFPRGNTEIIPPWAIEFYREEVLPKISGPNDYPELLYVSRSDSGIRNVSNEEEVFNLLEKKGFKSFILSKLPLMEKAKLFNKARVVISTIGAGMGNVVFCKKDASVLEFFPPSYPLPHYADISLKLGLNYHYLLGDSETNAKNLHQAQRDHLNIDLKKLEEKLAMIL